MQPHSNITAYILAAAITVCFTSSRAAAADLLSEASLQCRGGLVLGELDCRAPIHVSCAKAVLFPIFIPPETNKYNGWDWTIPVLSYPGYKLIPSTAGKVDTSLQGTAEVRLGSVTEDTIECGGYCSATLTDTAFIDGYCYVKARR